MRTMREREIRQGLIRRVEEIIREIKSKMRIEG
jgi:hypothetical protein